MRILLVVYDNEDVVNYFPVGTAYIASVLRNAGHEVVIYDQGPMHLKDDHITKWLDSTSKFDMVGFGFVGGYFQYKKLKSISAAINASINRPEMFVLGGHGPSPEPEYFLRLANADIVVIGEGENTMLELANRVDLANINGIAYIKNNKLIKTPTRDIIKDLDTIPWPAYDLFDMKYYKMRRNVFSKKTDYSMIVTSGRGCHFKCNFCYRLEPGLRTRNVDNVIDEIKHLNSKYGITYITFSDELAFSSPERMELFCNKLKETKLDIRWKCNGRLNYAKPDILKLMKNTGCVYINYGIEAFDNNILKIMKKGLTTDIIEQGIQNTLDAKISIGFNVIWGNLKETAETLRKGKDFLLKYDPGDEIRTIRPVTPYPGSPLYYIAIKKGLLSSVNPAKDFYENKHTNSDLLAVNFTELSNKEFYEELYKANCELLDNYFDNTKEKYRESLQELYINQNTDFRGYRVK